MLQYLTGRPDVTYRDVDRWQLFINELLEHPRFRFNWAEQIKDGVMAALHRFGLDIGWLKPKK